MIPSCLLHCFLTLVYLTLNVAHETHGSQHFSSKQKQGTKSSRRDVWHEPPTPELWGVTGPPAVRPRLPDPWGASNPDSRLFGPACLDRCHPAFHLLRERNFWTSHEFCLPWVSWSVRALLEAFHCFRKKNSNPFNACVWKKGLLLESAYNS